MGHPTDVGVDKAGALSPGAILGRYEIRRRLGAGGSAGRVYEAVNRDRVKRVAIKTQPPGPAANHEARARFVREAMTALRVRHPNLVDVSEVVEDGPVSFLVMEMLEGEDLAQLIARKGPLSIAAAVEIMLPVMAAIAAAHEQGVIHRDLRPEHIFLARTAQGAVAPKVLNLGFSKPVDVARTVALAGSSAPVATPSYMAPEQLRGGRGADARTDQYSLGTILYECLTGRRAFEGENSYATLRIISAGAYPAARSWRPELPARLDALVSQAISLDPAARFESVRDLGAALMAFAAPAVANAWRPTFIGPAPQPAPAAAQAGRTLVLADSPPSSPRRAEPARARSGRRPVPDMSTPFESEGSGWDNAAAGRERRAGARTPRRSRAPLLFSLFLILLVGAAVGLAAADHQGFKRWRRYVPAEALAKIPPWLLSPSPPPAPEIFGDRGRPLAPPPTPAPGPPQPPPTPGAATAPPPAPVPAPAASPAPAATPAAARASAAAAVKPEAAAGKRARKPNHRRHRTALKHHVLPLEETPDQPAAAPEAAPEAAPPSQE
jgi:serine/threonine protein kinase